MLNERYLPVVTTGIQTLCIIGAGRLAANRGLFEPTSVCRILNRFVVVVCLPALQFWLLAIKTDMRNMEMACTAWVVVFERGKLSRIGVHSLVLVANNTGILAPVVLEAAVGPSAAAIGMLATIVLYFQQLPTAMVLFEMDRIATSKGAAGAAAAVAASAGGTGLQTPAGAKAPALDATTSTSSLAKWLRQAAGPSGGRQGALQKPATSVGRASGGGMGQAAPGTWPSPVQATTTAALTQSPADTRAGCRPGAELPPAPRARATAVGAVSRTYRAAPLVRHGEEEAGGSQAVLVSGRDLGVVSRSRAHGLSSGGGSGTEDGELAVAPYAAGVQVVHGRTTAHPAAVTAAHQAHFYSLPTSGTPTQHHAQHPHHVHDAGGQHDLATSYAAAAAAAVSAATSTAVTGTASPAASSPERSAVSFFNPPAPSEPPHEPSLRHAAQLVLSNALMWTTGAATVVSMLGLHALLDPSEPTHIPLLGFVEGTLAWLARCSVPVSLFAMGLWGASRAAETANSGGGRGWIVKTVVYMAIKLLLLPWVMVFVNSLLGLGGRLGRSMVVLTCVPVGQMAFVVSEQYGEGAEAVTGVMQVGLLLMLPHVVAVMAALRWMGLYEEDMLTVGGY
ncbi:hypothetical protein HYH02_005132 [Chlamydomonas schloesseri]|uniref:Auxin efflux carrier component n=1 Tax=Chlamydomonas schloesseri TaxID=2026947 RepID=A0A835WLV4_9CHLO|nr:hypothetical protein HYH02_005132 [Chlamydomonas schloesseri]|eukprot:KAG2449599.1 hypothetical protein HYH02_005132 [Chlamydomonas schloesseri]